MKKIILSLCVSSLLVSCTFGKVPPPGVQKPVTVPQTIQNPPKTGNTVKDGSIVTPAKPVAWNTKIPLMVDVPNPKTPSKNQFDIK